MFAQGGCHHIHASGVKCFGRVGPVWGAILVYDCGADAFDEIAMFDGARGKAIFETQGVLDRGGVVQLRQNTKGRSHRKWGIATDGFQHIFCQITVVCAQSCDHIRESGFITQSGKVGGVRAQGPMRGRLRQR